VTAKFAGKFGSDWEWAPAILMVTSSDAGNFHGGWDLCQEF